MKLIYKKDENDQEILCDETGNHQVMMEWEKPYMEFSIEKLNPTGHVLEIGFGMGYSATSICSYKDVSEYSVVECCPEVWKKFESWKETQRKDLKINLIKGRWEDIVPSLETKFDCIYFDDYNYENNFMRFFSFAKLIKENVKIGSRMSVYSGNNTEFIKSEQFSTEIFDFPINIPENCKYAKGTNMYVPIYTVNELPLIIEVAQNKQIKKINDFINKPKNIYCNLLVIDNFYTNSLETRNYALTLDYSVHGNYPGKRTKSFATFQIKNIIESHISHFAGKITDWPMNSDTYNGAYQYTTSRDRTWIHTDSHNNWAGVLYLTPGAPVTSGTGFYRFKNGIRTEGDASTFGCKEVTDKFSQDYTKWELVDQVGNIFNRLVLFNSKQFHASMDYFGTSKEDGRLFQVFFFTTEK